MSGEQLKKILGKTGKSYVEIAALLGMLRQEIALFMRFLRFNGFSMLNHAVYYPD